MKKILSILFSIIFSICSYSQCSLFIETSKDKFTDVESSNNKIPIKVILNDGTVIDVSLLQISSKDISLSFDVSKKRLGCTDEKSAVYFIFSDNSKCKVQNRDRFSCDNNLTIFITGFLGDKTLFDNILIKNIKSIRLESMSNIIDFDLTDNQSNIIKNTFICLNSNIKL